MLWLSFETASQPLAFEIHPDAYLDAIVWQVFGMLLRFLPVVKHVSEDFQ